MNLVVQERLLAIIEDADGEITHLIPGVEYELIDLSAPQRTVDGLVSFARIRFGDRVFRVTVWPEDFVLKDSPAPMLEDA